MEKNKFNHYEGDDLMVIHVMSIAFSCRLRSIAAHWDHFVRRLSVPLCVCLSGSHTFLVVTHTYVSQASHAFLGMLPQYVIRMASFLSEIL